MHDEPAEAEPDPILLDDAPVDPAGPAAGIEHDIAWPENLEGIPILQFAGRAGGDHGFHPRLGVKCPCCNTQRTRSIELLKAEFGRNAPLAFLGAWLDGRFDKTPAEHKAWKPSIAQIRAYHSSKLSG